MQWSMAVRQLGGKPGDVKDRQTWLTLAGLRERRRGPRRRRKVIRLIRTVTTCVPWGGWWRFPGLPVMRGKWAAAAGWVGAGSGANRCLTGHPSAVAGGARLVAPGVGQIVERPFEWRDRALLGRFPARHGPLARPRPHLPGSGDLEAVWRNLSLKKEYAASVPGKRKREKRRPVPVSCSELDRRRQLAWQIGAVAGTVARKSSRRFHGTRPSQFPPTGNANILRAPAAACGS